MICRERFCQFRDLPFFIPESFNLRTLCLSDEVHSKGCQKELAGSALFFDSLCFLFFLLTYKQLLFYIYRLLWNMFLLYINLIEKAKRRCYTFQPDLR